MKRERIGQMNAHATPSQALNFRARSLLAFVLEPTEPVADWFAALDAWLVRSPTFFASKPVVLEMAGIELSLKEYRNLLSNLALRHIRVMGVENASQALVGPHLPPAVTGGRNVNAQAMLEESAPAESEPTKTVKAEKTEKTESLIVDGNVRSGQSVVHPDGDVTIVGRVASGAEIIAGGSVHVYGALQGRVIAGISGSSSARNLLQGGAGRTPVHRRRLCHGRRDEARSRGSEPRRPSGWRRPQAANPGLNP